MFSNYYFAAISTGQQLIHLGYHLFLDAQTHGITSELARGAEAQGLLNPNLHCSCFQLYFHVCSVPLLSSNKQ